MAVKFVTGFEQLDRNLALFEDKVQKKFVRTALRKAIKIVKTAFLALVPIGEDEEGNDTGVMRDAAAVRVPKSKKRGETKIGLIIDRAKLMTLYFQRYGRFPGKRKADSEPFFYPAVVELGDKHGDGQRPMRAALYGNESQVKAEFIDQLRMAVAEARMK